MGSTKQAAELKRRILAIAPTDFLHYLQPLIVNEIHKEPRDNVRYGIMSEYLILLEKLNDCYNRLQHDKECLRVKMVAYPTAMADSILRFKNFADVWEIFDNIEFKKQIHEYYKKVIEVKNLPEL